MTANINPIFTVSGDLSTNDGTTMSQAVLTAAADYTGISANNILIFTAGGNGSYIQRIRAKAVGTNVASVARVYINNGSIHTTAANNTFYGEFTLPAVTGIATAATAEIDYPMNFALNASFAIYVGLGTTVAAGWVFTAVAGQY
jgi:hypothetical protein